MSETKVERYQLDQDGKQFILSVSIIGDRIRFHAKDSLHPDGATYIQEYSVDELKLRSNFFSNVSNVYEAQDVFDKAIVNQKVGIVEEPNNFTLVFYLTNGDEKEKVNMALAYSSGKQYLNTNIVDYGAGNNRLDILQLDNHKIKDDQISIKEQMEKILLETQMVRNDSMILKEENKRLRERIRQLELQQRIHDERISGMDIEQRNDREDINLIKNGITSMTMSQNVETVRGDILHSTAELEMIARKINTSNQKITFNLIYKATVDSDQALAFHDKCDASSSTLVLVETTKGRRFGGFTRQSWRGDCVDKKDDDAFVFSLDRMQTYSIIPGQDAIGCYPNFGPVFFGCQIRIYDNCFTRGGTTFEAGMNYQTREDYELTCGDRNFGVREIEVYDVLLE